MRTNTAHIKLIEKGNSFLRRRPRPFKRCRSSGLPINFDKPRVVFVFFSFSPLAIVPTESFENPVLVGQNECRSPLTLFDSSDR